MLRRFEVLRESALEPLARVASRILSAAMGLALGASCRSAPTPPAEAPATVITIGAEPEKATSKPEAVVAAGRSDGMVRVDGGRYRMGSMDGDADERPVHEVLLRDYEIDVNEVTMRSYRACVSAGRCRAPYDDVWWPGMSSSDHDVGSRNCNAGKDDRDDHPVNCIDRKQAAQYCAFVGKRLPTEAEWEHAARGWDGRKYPWGDEEPTASHLNGCGRECTEMFRDWGFEVKETVAGTDGWRGTSPVGLFPAGASPYGVLDMAGNTWEWTASTYCGYPREDCEEGRITLRGGGWLNHDGAAGVRTTNRDPVDVGMRGSALGFRCARGAGEVRDSEEPAG